MSRDGGLAYIRGERLPEGGCGKTAGPIPKGAELGAGNGEQAGVSGAQSSGCGVEMEEVGQVLGGQAMVGRWR